MLFDYTVGKDIKQGIVTLRWLYEHDRSDGRPFTEFDDFDGVASVKKHHELLVQIAREKYDLQAFWHDGLIHIVGGDDLGG
jgi:hypothetical protein